MSTNEKKVKILDKYPYDTTPSYIPQQGPISTSTNPMNPNQLAEFEQKLKQGYTGVEIQTLRFESGEGGKGWTSIPKQIFEEVARLAHINNVDLSIHAPVQDIQLSGIMYTQQGAVYSKDFQKDAARKLSAVLYTAGEMAKIYGDSIRINVHFGEMKSAEWKKEREIQIKNYLKSHPEEFQKIKNYLGRLYGYDYVKNIKTVDDLPSWVFADTLYAVQVEPDKKTGRVSTIPTEEVYDPVTGKKVIKPVPEKLFEYNELIWKNNLAELWSEIQRIKNSLINIASEAGRALYDPSKAGLFYSAYSIVDLYTKTLKDRLSKIYEYYKDILENPDKAKKYLPNEEEYNRVISHVNKIKKELKKIETYRQELERLRSEIDKLEKNAPFINPEQYKEYAQYVFNKLLSNSYYYIEESERLLNDLGKISMTFGPPTILKPVPLLAAEKVPETIKEAMREYVNMIKSKKEEILKNPEIIDKILPTIILENSYAGSIGTRPDEAIEIIERSRKELVNFLQNLKNEFPELVRTIEEKYGSLENFAKEKIGATLDVGHLKGYVKSGYTKEDIVQWVRKLKPYIKQLHVHEAQWGDDVHLLPGMGWDDIIHAELEELRDKLAEQGVHFVLEPGGWYTSGLSQSYGLDYPFVLEYGGFQAYPGIPYGEALFSPNYFMSWPVMYTPSHAPQIYVTQYSPFVDSWSKLPPHLGGKRAETFSGRKLE